MAATYNDLIGLVTNTTFQNESPLAVTKFAQYIIGNFGSFTPRKISWAYNVVNSASANVGVASQIANVLIQDPIFTGQASGLSSSQMMTNINDAQFQAAVENAINTTILQA